MLIYKILSIRLCCTPLYWRQKDNIHALTVIFNHYITFSIFGTCVNVIRWKEIKSFIRYICTHLHLFSLLILYGFQTYLTPCIPIIVNPYNKQLSSLEVKVTKIWFIFVIKSYVQRKPSLITLQEILL